MLYWPISLIFRLVIFTRIIPVRVCGKEHLPKRGPVIFGPNHSDQSDWAAIAGTVPYKVRFMLKRDAGWLTRLILTSLLAMFVVRRTGVSTSAFKQAQKYLSQGKSIGYFRKEQDLES